MDLPAGSIPRSEHGVQQAARSHPAAEQKQIDGRTLPRRWNPLLPWPRPQPALGTAGASARLRMTALQNPSRLHAPSRRPTARVQLRTDGCTLLMSQTESDETGCLDDGLPI